MTTPEAAAIEIVAAPRLSVDRLVELRKFLDRTMIALSSGKQTSAGGHEYGEMEGASDKSVRGVAADRRTAGAATQEGVDVARVLTGRVARKKGRGRGDEAVAGGRR